MTALPPRSYREAAARIVPAQRCAFGDDDRGYCERPATVHLWTTDWPCPGDAGQTMSCAEHCAWFDTRRDLVVDHHPITAVCGLPDSWWVYSHPTGGPGWCEIDGLDWLSAVGWATQTSDPETLTPIGAAP